MIYLLLIKSNGRVTRKFSQYVLFCGVLRKIISLFHVNKANSCNLKQEDKDEGESTIVISH